MMLLIAGLLAVVTLALLILPLVRRGFNDPVPSFEDPLVQDLEEERDALFTAIRELEARDDLSRERRDQLRARYEAKAAKVLRRLDEHRLSESTTAATPPPRRRAPAGLLLTLVLIVPSLFLIGDYLLPRISGGTVTTFQAEDIATGRTLQSLQRAAQRNPSREGLLELADLYWQQGTVDPSTAPTAGTQATLQADAVTARQKAAELYGRVEEEFPPLPTVGHQRLGLLALNDQGDLEAGVARFEKARESDPDNLDTLYMLGELYYGQGRMKAAVEAWEAFRVAPNGGTESEAVLPRLEAARQLAPLTERVNEERNGVNLLAPGRRVLAARRPQQRCRPLRGSGHGVRHGSGQGSTPYRYRPLHVRP
jgi:cytochrome c-type biogenesis protein CcmH/NrfG